MFEIVFVVGIIFASMGIYGFLLKERGKPSSNHLIERLIQKAEYGKILSSACATIGVFIWFFSVPYSELNLWILIAYCFTFPGDIILSRDLTKLLIAIPLFAVAYTLMALRSFAVVASAPANPILMGSSLVISIGIMGGFLVVYGRKLTPRAFKIAAFIHALIDWLLLFGGISLVIQTLAILPGIGMILLVFGDLIAAVNIVKPFKNKPVYDLAGGIIYFVGLYTFVIYFTL